MEENKRLEQGFDDPGRQVLKITIVHYTTAAGNPYDTQEWEEAVKEYLLTAYSNEEKHGAITAGGKVYRILKRDGVTVFYDENGQTLFDVENDRLAKEHELLFSDLATKEPELVEEVGEGPKTEIGKAIAGIEKQAFEAAVSGEKSEDIGENEELIPMGTASLEEIVKGIPAPTPEEVETAKKNNSSVYIGVVGAVTKLQEELKKAKDKAFADPVIKHLIERCKESESLASDICQNHKTWEKCYKYIYEQARKQATGNRCAVRDDVVYEWAEDYFHKDDKAEEAKKAEEQKKKQEKAKAPEKKTQPKADTQKPAKSFGDTATRKAKENAKQIAPKAPVEKPKAEPKHKKSGNDMEGQMDLFSLMGM